MGVRWKVSLSLRDSLTIGGNMTPRIKARIACVIIVLLGALSVPLVFGGSWIEALVYGLFGLLFVRSIT